MRAETKIKTHKNWGLFNPPKSERNNKGGGGVLASRAWAGEVGPHIPGRARQVGEARVGLQPLLRLRRNAAEDDVQSPEAHVDRLADRDARQASTEVALYSPPRLHLAVAEPEPPVVGRAARDRSIALARGVRRDQRDVVRQALADLDTKKIGKMTK